MSLFSKRLYLFKCLDCETVIEIDLESPEEIEKYNNDKLQVRCNCGGFCNALRD